MSQTFATSPFPYKFAYRRQNVGAILYPTDSVWDGYQTITTKDAKGNERCRGDFDVDGLRIFAENLTVAKMIARRIVNGHNR